MGVWNRPRAGWNSPLQSRLYIARTACVFVKLVHSDGGSIPMKRVEASGTRVSWDDAIGEIVNQIVADPLISPGPDCVLCAVDRGAKFLQRSAYLFRKFAPCGVHTSELPSAHMPFSTTVAGVANTGATARMTTLQRYPQSPTDLIWGRNPADALPVSPSIVAGRNATGGELLVVVVLRLNTTAAHRTRNTVRIRPGTDIAALWGLFCGHFF